MSEAVVSATVGMLGDLLKEEVTILSGVRDQVHDLQEKLKEIQCFLKDADKKQYEAEIVRNWVRSIKNLAYRTENVLEIYAIKVESRKGKGIKKALKRFACIFDEGITLHKVGVEIGKIKNQVSSLMERVETSEVKLDKEAQSSNAATKDLLRQTFAHDIEEHFVGMQSDVNILISLISDRDKDHRIISLYGMGGSGKTTLAKQVFNHREVQTRFESFAWVAVSQQCIAESLLRDILRQLDPLRNKDDIKKMEYRELVEELCKAQTKKKCLVVLDDIWKREDWIILSPAFPISVINCKVLLTTRIQDVAEIGIPHKLNLFSEEEGWQLLKKKALSSANDGDSSVQAKKEKLGKEMVRNCGYLPLAISVIGGILSKKVALEEWKMVNRDINSYLKYGEGMEENYQVIQILSLSYDNLPYHLKPCFLYLANYPEDSEINVDTLYRMWIAEGMVLSNDQRRNETLLDVADRYLIELANRSLVHVQLDESMMFGRIKSCHLHDLLRDLCLRKCKEDDFLEVIDFRGEQPHTSLGGNAYRLAIYGEMDENVGDKILREANKSTRLYSLIAHEVRTHKVIKDLGKLRFLNVLVFEGLEFVNTKLLHKVIKKLILLKFLSFTTCELDEMPSSIGALRYLQTFWLDDCDDVKIPDVFWKLEKLMHLCLRGRMGGSEIKLRVDGLKMLETLICPYDYSIEVQDLPTLTNLRVCSLQVEDNESLSSIIGCIEVNWCNIRSLGLQIYPNCNFNTTNGSTLLYKLFKCRALKDLGIQVPMRELPKYESGMLSDLFDLELRYCFVVEDPMPTLEKLPKLASLTLQPDSFKGKELICSSVGFPNLKKLWLCCLHNLKNWRIDEGAMPHLSSVLIYGCSKLEMIPEGMKFLKELKELKSKSMSTEFNNRIRVVNGEEGADFHKVCHVPLISIEDEYEVPRGIGLPQSPTYPYIYLNYAYASRRNEIPQRAQRVEDSPDAQSVQ